MQSNEKIEKALDAAQAELRALYKRLGIINSNVLMMVDEARYTAALLGPSKNLRAALLGPGTPITKTIDSGNAIFSPNSKYYLNLKEKIVVCSFMDKPGPPPGIVIGEFDDDFVADKYFDEMVKWRYNSKTIPIDPDCFEVAKKVAAHIALFGNAKKYNQMTSEQISKEFLPIPEDAVAFRWLNDGVFAWFGPPASGDTQLSSAANLYTTRATIKWEIIDFAQWYSGMERAKVEKAFDRYLKERAEALADAALKIEATGNNPPDISNLKVGDLIDCMTGKSRHSGEIMWISPDHKTFDIRDACGWTISGVSAEDLRPTSYPPPTIRN